MRKHRCHRQPWPGPLLLVGWVGLTCLLFGAAAVADAPLWLEPLDGRAGSLWHDAAPALQLDPIHGRLRPTGPNQVASVTYALSMPSTPEIVTGEPVLLRYDITLSRPGDRVWWEQLPPDGPPVMLAEHTWQSGRHTLDLTSRFTLDPLRLRLSIESGPAPVRVSVGNLAWQLGEAHLLVPTELVMRPAEWLFPAWQLRSAPRTAPSFAPGRLVRSGWGRITLPLPADWRSVSGGWRADHPRLSPVPAGRVRHLVAATGEQGGELWLAERLVAQHATPFMPIGVRLNALNWPAVAPPPVTVIGVAAPDAVQVVETGPLEIRHVVPDVAWRDDHHARVRLQAIVINHTEQDVEGNVVAVLTDVDGGQAAVAMGGHRWPPGPWLTPLVLDVAVAHRLPHERPIAYRMHLRVDDGGSVSDAWNTSLPLTTDTDPVDPVAAMRAAGRDSLWGR